MHTHKHTHTFMLLTNLTFSMADSVSISPSVQIEMDTLLFLKASSWYRDPKNPFRADFVEVYGATNGLGTLPANHKQLSGSNAKCLEEG